VIAGERQEGNGRGDAVRLSSGGSFEGYESCAAGKCRAIRPCSRAHVAETQRTSGPAAGCNKPAACRAEETVEVVQNHAGGTRLRGWHPEAEAQGSSRRRSGRSAGTSVEGQWRVSRSNWPGRADGNPGEKVARPGRSVQLRRGAKIKKVRVDMVLRDSVGRPMHGIPRGSVRRVKWSLRRKPRGTPDIDGQGRGGGREGQTTCYVRRSGDRRLSKDARRCLEP